MNVLQLIPDGFRLLPPGFPGHTDPVFQLAFIVTQDAGQEYRRNTHLTVCRFALTGQKLQKKMAYRHSGYPGGLTATSYAELLEKHPTRAVEKAIRGMLPKNSLGRQQLSKLKVYAGAEHPHAAQQPQTYTFDQVAQ